MTDWIIKNNVLTKEFEFNTFTQAVEFIQKIAAIAQQMDHHPDILLHSYRKVKIMLTTHSENLVTQKDYSLAKNIDLLL